MSVLELKARVHQYVDEADTDMLEQLQRIFKKHYDKPHAELGGMTIEEYNNELNEAEAEIDRGEFYTQEEVEAKMEKLFKIKK